MLAETAKARANPGLALWKLALWKLALWKAA
jgi:hypothetical protein